MSLLLHNSIQEKWTRTLLVSRPVDEDSNVLARYVARYGAEHYERMVIFANPFGRVREIWHHDMGMSPIGDQFVTVNEPTYMMV